MEKLRLTGLISIPSNLLFDEHEIGPSNEDSAITESYIFGQVASLKASEVVNLIFTVRMYDQNIYYQEQTQ